MFDVGSNCGDGSHGRAVAVVRAEPGALHPTDTHSLTHCRRDVGKGPVSDYQLLTIISCTIRVLASTAFVTAVPHLVILTEVTDNYEFASC